MKETGEILKKAREEKGISLREVSSSTKINQRILESIESGDVNAQPQKAFLRGFVQSYAAFLKLDMDLVMKTFHDEMGSTRPETDVIESEFASSDNEESSKEKESTKIDLSVPQGKSLLHKIMSAVGALLLLGLIMLVLKTVEKYEKDSRTDELPMGIEPSQLQPIEQDTDMRKDLSTISSPVVKIMETQTPASPAVKVMGTQTPVPPASIPPPARVEVTATSQASPEEKPKEEPQPVTPPVIQGQELIIEALDHVTVEFKIDADGFQKITMKPEQIQTVKAKKSIELRISDGGLVTFIYNGQDRGVPGNLGSSLTVAFPK